MLDWLTDNKIPVGTWAAGFFEWLQTNGEWFFDGLAVLMETMIDAILWVLQTPHPFVIIACFVALTWVLQRSWKTCLFVVLGFLFILNQDYWEEMTESLTLVLSACVVCMAVGVPIGIAAAHRPAPLSGDAPRARPDADTAHLRLSDPGDRVFRHRHGAGADRHGDLCAARTDPPDASGCLLDPETAAGGRECLWRHAEPEAPGRWNCPMPCRRSWRGSTRPSCCRSRWW